MNNLELTKACAKAMGYEWLGEDSGDIMHPRVTNVRSKDGNYPAWFRPLHDDAQAMALVKKFYLHIANDPSGWDVKYIWRGFGHMDDEYSFSEDLNRAICQCVAKLGASDDK